MQNQLINYPKLFLQLKKDFWLPLKVANHKIIKAKCVHCGQVVDGNKMLSHSCPKREEWEWC